VITIGENGVKNILRSKVIDSYYFINADLVCNKVKPSFITNEET